MRRTLLLIFTLFTVTLTAVTQPRVSPNKETHNFGQTEWRKPVTVRYTIASTGNEPLVLTNITIFYTYAVADWTKEPTAPDAKGAVKASFDTKALGRFDKSIGIYSNATPNLVYSKFTGEVVQEIKDYLKLPLYAIGDIRIDRNEFSPSDVYHGQQPSMTFNVTNLSDRPYEPVLTHLPPYLKMETEPKALLKGKEGTIELTLDVSQLQDFGSAQTSVYLSCFSGDEVSGDNEISVLTTLLPDFSRTTEKDSLNAPSIHVSETSTDLSISLIKKNKASYDILIANVGKAPLVIGELQVFNSSVGVRLKKTVIPPDGTTESKVAIHKRGVGDKKRHLHILTITNDPLCPKVEINIKR